jgi:hypothetical protein
VWLLTARPKHAALVLLVYGANVAFAFSYNVGDTHVFYLPSHIMVALLAGIAAAATGRFAPVIAGVLLIYAGARGYRDFPALDRSSDTRPEQVVSELTDQIDDQRSILLVDLNWQVANGLSYFTKSIKPRVAATRMRDVLLYAPALIHDNLVAGRDVEMTARAHEIFTGSYDHLFTAQPSRVPATLAQTVRGLAQGTRYALCVLKPTREFAIDSADLQSASKLLGLTASELTAFDYSAVAGLIGEPPSIVAMSNRPFARTGELNGASVVVRMESWLASDTIRRMGFGHVIAGRNHTLIVERGLSFAAFDVSGKPLVTAYFSNIFATPERYLISSAASDLSSRTRER